MAVPRPTLADLKAAMTAFAQSIQTRELALAALAFVGFVVVSKYLLSLLTCIWRAFLSPASLPSIRRKHGSWAVVTGATDGIGLEYAIALRKRGFNVLLVSRTESKLKDAKEKLEALPNTKGSVDYIAIDFAKATDKDYDKLSAFGDKHMGDVALLVNNVGMSYPHAMFFHELDAETIASLINVNVVATTRVTHALLPAIMGRATDATKGGVVLNIGSGAATALPSDPLYSVYAGSKAYVQQWTRSMAVEYRAKKVTFQLQAPLYVATKMAKIRKATFTAPSARTFVESSLGRVGNPPIVTTPYWVHGVLWSILNTIPETAVDYARMSMCLSIRKRALKKKAEKEKEKK